MQPTDSWVPDLPVLTNADTTMDARTGLRFGASGIGLARTEHMFLGERAAVLERMLTDGNDEVAATEFEAVQCDLLTDLLEVCDGLMVTVRLLDAPSHEFAPGAPREVNPMLGARGVRLATVRPDLYRRQLAALAEAVRRRRSAGGEPRTRVLVPMVSYARRAGARVGMDA